MAISTGDLIGIDKCGEFIDVSGLDEEDIQVVQQVIQLLREKNRK